MTHTCTLGFSNMSAHAGQDALKNSFSDLQWILGGSMELLCEWIVTLRSRLTFTNICTLYIPVSTVEGYLPVEVYTLHIPVSTVDRFYAVSHPVHMNIPMYGMYMCVICCMGDFKGKTVHKIMMCAHFPDVCTLHFMLHCG